MANKVLGRKGNAITDQLRASRGSLDKKDPIYDSEEEGNVYFELYRPMNSIRHPLQKQTSTYICDRVSNIRAANSIPYPEFIQKITEEVLPDAILSEGSSDVCNALRELNCPQYHCGFVVKAIRMALDHEDEKQKWMSELLTILYDSHIISRAAFNRAFVKLVQTADDIKLDVPNCFSRIYMFIKWAVADEVLDPLYPLRLPESFLTELLITSDSLYKLPSSEKKKLQDHLHMLQTYKAAVEKFVVNDFLVIDSQDDLKQLLQELGHPEFKHEVVRRLIKVSMGMTDREREMVSTALSANYGSDVTSFNSDDIFLGCARLLGEIEDLQMDVPYATTLLSKFLVRAVVDEILPPAFILHFMRLGLGGDLGKTVTKTVKKWVIEEGKGVMHVSKFQKIWTATDPDSPDTKEFNQKICELINHHFDDGDFATTKQQIEELEMSPDQAIFFVYKAIVISLGRRTSHQQMMPVIELLKFLIAEGEIEISTIKDGLDRIVIDVPYASDYLHNFITNAKSCHLLPDDYQTSH